VKCTEEKWTCTWDELLDRIIDAIARMNERQDKLTRRATRHVLTRVEKGIDVDGVFFENVL
jgi:hypothetical protein